jgi:hypothetical protein
MDDARQKGADFGSEVFDGNRLIVSLLIGAIAGGLGILTLTNFQPLPGNLLTAQTFFGLIGIGYAGTDFIEGFIGKYLPSRAGASGPTKVPDPATPALLSAPDVAAAAASAAAAAAPAAAAAAPIAAPVEAVSANGASGAPAGAEPAAAPAAAARDSGPRRGVRFRRGSRGPMRAGDVPLVGVVRQDAAPVAAIAPPPVETPAKPPVKEKAPRQPRAKAARKAPDGAKAAKRPSRAKAAKKPE